jgi:hypothetical protein
LGAGAPAFAVFGFCRAKSGTLVRVFFGMGHSALLQREVDGRPTSIAQYSVARHTMGDTNGIGKTDFGETVWGRH